MNQHDWDLLQEVLQMQNAGENISPDDPHFLAILTSLCDEEVMMRVAMERARSYIKYPPPSAELMQEWVAACWLDAFATGVMFQRSGGHKEEQ